MKTLKNILDWSEVWALLLPLGVLIFRRRKQTKELRSVVIYVILAFVINLLIDLIVDYPNAFPTWLKSNNPLYTLHSILRFTCFSWFLLTVTKPEYRKIQWILIWVFVAFFILNFIFFENILEQDHISGNILTAESFIILANCMIYYYGLLMDESIIYSKQIDFWIVTGLSIFVVISFFLFLFYLPLITENPKLANSMWDFHNLAFIMFCIFIAKAFYVSSRN